MKFNTNNSRAFGAAIALSVVTSMSDAGPILVDDLRYDFEEGRDGWLFQTFDPPFDPPNADTTGGSLNIDATNNTNTFGSWESPEASIPGGPLLKEEKLFVPDLFRITARYKSDVNSVENTPNFRTRTFFTNFHQSSIMTVESVGDSSYCPPGNPILLKGEGSDKGFIDLTGKRYNYYFYSMLGGDTLKHAFDLLNFGGFDDPNGSLSLDYLAVNRVSEVGQAIQETYDCTDPTDQATFSNFTAPGVQSPLRIIDGTGMGLFGLFQIGVKEENMEKGGPIVPWIFGGYTRTLETPIASDTVYRLDVTIGSSTTPETRNDLPSFRIRVNDSSFQGSWYLNVDSPGNALTLPSQNGDITYRLYFEPRPELAGNSMIFTLDYLWVNGDGNSPYKVIDLKEVQLMTTSFSGGSL